MNHVLKAELRSEDFREEEEFARRQKELASLEELLSERELELATLTGELRLFESEYLRVVGTKYADLDRINAEIAHLVAEKSGDADARARAGEARERAEQSRNEANEALKEKREKFEPTEELKTLFREAALKFHPDKTTDADQKARAQKLFVSAKDAYDKGDLESLRNILKESSPGLESVTAMLTRLIRQIEQIQRRLEEIPREIEDLKNSELWRLRARVYDARLRGRDLLKKMAEELDSRIRAAESELLRVKSQEER